MKEKIWFFGCSHSTGNFNLSSSDECWTTRLADKFNFEEVNKASVGASNDDILIEIINNISLINPTDLVIVLFTHPHRIRYNSTTLLPSNESSQWFYRSVNADDFYYYKLLQIVLATKYLMESKQYICSFVDPTLLLTHFRKHSIKNLVIDKHTMLLPKITLHKSFPLGEDNKHLSNEGHARLFEFFSNLLDEQV